MKLLKIINIVLLFSFYYQMNSHLIIGFISFPKNEIAKKVARILINDKIAACAKIISGIESFYLWEDKLQQDEEVYLMIKSQEEKIEAIKHILDQEHPYKIYEFLYHRVESGNDKYTDWINSTLKGVKSLSPEL